MNQLGPSKDIDVIKVARILCAAVLVGVLAANGPSEIRVGDEVMVID